jgi:hypothetical protein
MSYPYTLRLSALALAAAVGFGVSQLTLVAEPADSKLAGPASVPEQPAEAPFLAENDAAMTKMMNDMAVKPSGDIDRDFALMMIPHHQGAVDMALAELRYGKNEQLRRIAQEIVVEQMQEIAAMRLAIGDTPPASAPAPTQQQALSADVGAPAAAMQHHHHTMPTQ